MDLELELSKAIVLPFLYDEKLNKSVVIAENYAIGFGEFLIKQINEIENLSEGQNSV